MRNLLLITILIFVAISVNAQGRSFDCLKKRTNDSRILDAVQKQYSTINSLAADFSQQSFLAALETSEVSSGKVWFKKPGTMKWHYQSPEDQVMILNDNTMWLYQSADNQVIIDSLSDVLLSDLPVSFLVGLGDLTRDFVLESSCDTAEGISLILKSKSKNDKKNELKSFTLLVSSTEYSPIGAQVFDISGNVTSIVFNKIQSNTEIKDELFKPNFPKGVDVQDRRGTAESLGGN